jgi:AcrR family transcriptional regulator
MTEVQAKITDTRAAPPDEAPSRTPPSRRDRRKAETRERIFEAAMALLAERDFDAVTVEMITEAADVGKGTFFNYFDNKEAVVGCFFEKQLALLTEMLQAAPVAPPPQQECAQAANNLWERIRAITHLLSERNARSKRWARTMLALVLTNAAVRAAHLSVRRRALEMSSPLVRASQEANELRADLPAETIAEYMIDVYFHALYAWSQSEADDSLNAAIDRTYALVWEGLHPR